MLVWCYNRAMKFFVKSRSAPKFRFKNADYMGLGLAAVFTVFSVAQLFTFEDFMVTIQGSLSPVSGILAALAPSIIVTSGVVFLPFLLRMKLSPAFRWLSMLMGWFASAGWVILAIRSFYMVSRFALMGDVVSISGGVPSLVAALLITLCVAVVSYGLWPGRLSVSTKE